MQITVYNALRKLKLIEDKLKETNRLEIGCIGYQTPATTAIAEKQKRFLETNQALLDSIIDLCTEYDKLKEAIILSNATTMINVGGVTMTVAAAIERKKSIQHKSQLATVISNNINRLNNDHANKASEFSQRYDQYVAAKEKETKNKEAALALTTEYRERNEPVILQINARGKTPAEFLTTLRDECSNFMQEIDVALTESNCSTLIEV